VCVRVCVCVCVCVCVLADCFVIVVRLRRGSKEQIGTFPPGTSHVTCYTFCKSRIKAEEVDASYDV
jgi:hypothetical protein